MREKITQEMITALKQEVAILENNNTNDILVFEKSLQELQDLYPMENLDWSLNLDSIEIITLEEHPSLSSSIRRVLV